MKCRRAWTQFDVSLMHASAFLVAWALLAAAGIMCSLGGVARSMLMPGCCGSTGIGAFAGLCISAIYFPVEIAAVGFQLIAWLHAGIGAPEEGTLFNFVESFES